LAEKIVVDTSVLIKWIKTRDEDLLPEARTLLRVIDSSPLEVHVPSLLLYEAGNVLLAKSRLSVRELGAAFEHLVELPLIVAPPASPLLRRAAQLGRRFTLTFYDASFLALAGELDCVLVTADRRIFDRVGDPSRVRHLSNLGKLP